MRFRKQLPILGTILVIAILLATNTLGQTADDLNNETISQEEERTYSIEQTDKSHYPKLLQKARTEGKIRIIVGVKTAFKPEGWHRSLAAVENQRLGIATAQDSLLKSVLIPDESTIKKFKYIPFIAMEVDETALQSLIDNPMVISIEEDKLLKPMLYDTIPLIGADTGEADYSTGYTGKGQTIAIIDTGVDKTHPFLSGKVVAEACYSSGTSSLCPNGQKEQIGSGSGVNCSSSIHSCEHGTHVAGIAAGKKYNNGTYNLRGVAPNANIIAIQVFTKKTGTSSIGSYPADQISALEHVYELRNTYNIASVNMSLGGDKYTSNCDNTFSLSKAAIDQLRSVGIATVIASGNGDSNHNGYINALSAPACISSAVSVGATEYLGIWEEVAPYSNSASFLSLLAPGGHIADNSFWELPNSWYGIYSSIPYDSTLGYWAKLTGTSMAAPHVAGAWALMKEKYPSASVDTILSAFKTTGKSFTDSKNNIIKPRIKVDSALAALPTLPNLTPYKPSGWSDKIVVSITSGATSDSSTIYTTDNVYVRFAIANDSGSNISTTFYTTIYVDGIAKQTISKSSLSAGYYSAYIGANIGTLSAGSHTIKIVVDSTNAVSESNESDNEYSKTITVTASCTYTISPTSQSFTSAGGTGSVSVTASSSSCSWTATESLSWVSITSGSSGTGSGTVSYSVSANTSTSSRSGNMTIAGQTFTISQTGTVCTATLSSDLKLNIPVLSFNGSYYQIGLDYVSTTDGLVWFKLTSAASTQSSCSSPSTLTLSAGTYTLHVPYVTYGSTSYWADFEYVPTTDGQIWFKLTNAGKN